MRGAVLGSGVVHVVLVTILLLVRPPMSIVVPGPDVVQVALVDPSAPIAQPLPAPKPPEPEPEKLQPDEEEGVRLERERPKPKRKEPEPQRPPARSQPTAGLPSAQVGSAGLQGDMSVDTGNFEFTYYLILVRNKIASNWMPPAGVSTGGRQVRAVVYFRIHRNGELDAIRIETPSGVEFFDRSAVRAVTISDPLPPLPLGFAGGELGVHFGFAWEAQ